MTPNVGNAPVTEEKTFPCWALMRSESGRIDSGLMEFSFPRGKSGWPRRYKRYYPNRPRCNRFVSGPRRMHPTTQKIGADVGISGRPHASAGRLYYCYSMTFPPAGVVA